MQARRVRKLRLIRLFIHFSNSLIDGSAPRVATARAGNIIGGGDWGEDRLIPDLARALRTGEKAHIRFPHAVRPWQFVLDALAGYLILAERLFVAGNDFVGAWNFGPMDGNLWTVDRVVKTFCGENGPSVELKNSTENARKEHVRPNLDSSKAKKQLGWFAQMPIPTFLSRTRRWYEMSIEVHQLIYYVSRNSNIIQNFNLD